MADTDLSQKDIQDSQLFMQQFLTGLIPDGDFTEGTAEYDHLVKGFSYVFAYLKKLVGNEKARRSLLTLGDMSPDQNVDEAADAILSNLFQSRDRGRVARGPLVVHLSARTDLLVRTTDRFFKTRSLYYLVDSASNYLLPASRLRPNVNSNGEVIDYVGTIPVVAARAGSSYNQQPGRFINFERTNPFITYVENTSPLEGGADSETTSDFIERASVAVSIQALINARSNTSLLRKLFPVIKTVTTIGNGDAEMVRDIITEPGSGLVLHVGGHVDIVVKTPTQEVTERLLVGSSFVRPDEKVLIFRHDNSVNFLTGSGLTGGKPVIPGDVLNLTSGLPEAPFQYLISSVGAQELVVHARTPFSRATDEDTTTSSDLAYTIGNDYPGFSNKHSGSLLAETSRSMTVENGVMLQGRPVYRVKRVEIPVPPTGYEQYIDQAAGGMVFNERVNDVPAIPTGSSLQYRVRVLNPHENQSSRAVTLIELGWPGSDFTDTVVEVTYDTLASFTTIDTYVSDRENRPSAANTLLRARHPVVLSMTVPYAVNSAPTPFRASTGVVFNEAASVESLADFINNYEGENVVDVSLLATEVRAKADTVAAVYPFSIEYELLGPDGRVFKYATTDRVTVFPDGTRGAQLLNPTDFGLPSTDYYAALEKLLRGLGVSDRNLRYLTSIDEISLERRA